MADINNNNPESSNSYTLITGGSTGIGFELDRIFAENVHNLIMFSLDEADLAVACQKLTDACKVKVVTIPKDLSLPESAQQVYREVKKKGLHVDILVNNAGQGHFGEFRETELHKE